MDCLLNVRYITKVDFSLLTQMAFELHFLLIDSLIMLLSFTIHWMTTKKKMMYSQEVVLKLEMPKKVVLRNKKDL